MFVVLMLVTLVSTCCWSTDTTSLNRSTTGEVENRYTVSPELKVLADVESLPPEHPDAVAVRLATAGIFKSVRKARRKAKRNDPIDIGKPAEVPDQPNGADDDERDRQRRILHRLCSVDGRRRG